MIHATVYPLTYYPPPLQSPPDAPSPRRMDQQHVFRILVFSFPLACPHPFTYEWQQSCYYFSISRYSITYSSSFCEYLSSHLVYIESEAEEAAIFSSLSARNSNGDHWIGLTGSSSTDVTWQDGKSPNYTNFRSDSFDGFGANFVLKYPDYYWDNGGVVNTDSHFICEQELGQQDQDTVEDEEEVTNVPGRVILTLSPKTACNLIVKGRGQPWRKRERGGFSALE